MLTLPIYLRNSSYYFHTRIFGKQVKRSLHTNDRHTAIIRASKLLECIQMDIDLSKIRKYELDLSRGIARSDGAEDHQRMMDAIVLLQKSQNQQQPHTPEDSSLVRASSTKSLTLLELLDKYFLLKQVKPATILAHKNTVKEFEIFFKLKIILPFGEDIFQCTHGYPSMLSALICVITHVDSLYNMVIVRKVFYNNRKAVMQVIRDIYVE